jgi:hypothetical protein
MNSESAAWVQVNVHQQRMCETSVHKFLCPTLTPRTGPISCPSDPSQVPSFTRLINWNTPRPLSPYPPQNPEVRQHLDRLTSQCRRRPAEPMDSWSIRLAIRGKVATTGGVQPGRVDSEAAQLSQPPEPLLNSFQSSSLGQPPGQGSGSQRAWGEEMAAGLRLCSIALAPNGPRRFRVVAQNPRLFWPMTGRAKTCAAALALSLSLGGHGGCGGGGGGGPESRRIAHDRTRQNMRGGPGSAATTEGYVAKDAASML